MPPRKLSDSARSTAVENLALKWTPAVVVWESSDGQEQSLQDAQTELLYNPDDHTASFRLKAKVALRGQQHPFYIFVDPTCIRSIAVDSERSTARVPVAVREKFGQAARHLQFILSRAGELVGPGEIASWTPKNQAAGQVLDALRSMATATRIGVFLSCFDVPAVALSELCDAASAHGLGRLPGWPGLSRLYKGRGGRVAPSAVQGDIRDDVVGGPATEAEPDSPPSYDELGPGPPMPPVELQSLNKRRKLDSNNADGADSTQLEMESMCRKVLGDMKPIWTREIIEQARVAVLEDVWSAFEGMENRVVDRLEDKWSADLIRVEQDAEEHTARELEEWRLDMRIELEDAVREEMHEAENRIMRRMKRRLSSAHLTLELDSDDDDNETVSQ